MFFFISGINTRSKYIGDAPNVICPTCGAFSCMHITVVYEMFHIFFIPVFKWNRRYLATASCCGAVFELELEEGRAFERGEKSSVDPMRMHRVQGNTGFPDSCPYCGAQLPPGSKYCFQCGRPLR